MVLERVQKLCLGVLCGRGLLLRGLFLQAGQAVADDTQVPVNQLRLDDLPVAQRVDGLLRMGDGGVVEGPHHVQQRVRLRHEGQEGVAQPRALAGVAGEPRKVHKLHLRGLLAPGGEDLNQFVKAFIRHAHQRPVRLGLAAGVGLDLRPRPGDDIEHRGLARQRQANDSTFQQGNPLPKIILPLPTQAEEFVSHEPKEQKTVQGLPVIVVDPRDRVQIR